MYGDKKATIERFMVNVRRLFRSAQSYLVLENDEICYNVDDLLEVSEQLAIPMCQTALFGVSTGGSFVDGTPSTFGSCQGATQTSSP